MHYIILETKSEDRDEAIQAARDLLADDRFGEVTLAEAIPAWWKRGAKHDE